MPTSPIIIQRMRSDSKINTDGYTSLTEIYKNTIAGDLVIVYPGTYDIGNNSIQLKDGVNWQFIGKPTISSDSVNGTFDATSATEENPIICTFNGKVKILNTNGSCKEVVDLGMSPHYLIALNKYVSIFGIIFRIKFSYNLMGWYEGNPSPPTDFHIYEDDFNNTVIKRVYNDIDSFYGLGFDIGIPNNASAAAGLNSLFELKSYNVNESRTEFLDAGYVSNPLSGGYTMPQNGINSIIKIENTDYTTMVEASFKPTPLLILDVSNDGIIELTI